MIVRTQRSRTRGGCALVVALLAAACGELESEDALAPEPAPTAAAPLTSAREADAVRLLEQATFGARPVVTTETRLDTVARVLELGARGWIYEQLNLPPGSFAPTPSCGPAPAEFPPALDLGAQVFAAALTAPDQLRLRTMLALHQILVVSELGIPERKSTCTSERRDAMVGYFNLLRTRAFGSYRELLEAVVVSPAMGTFLDMANNRAFDKDGNRLVPNENFARELMQLFTIGTTQLNDDGTPVLVDGKPQPTYGEAEVQALAATLTGWTYPATCPSRGVNNPENYAAPMVPCDDNHDRRKARLLVYPGVARSGWTSDDVGARQHLEEALDNLFNHPSLPPFVCKQLIQHLVTSNPSPAYVARVVATFKDDGSAARRRGSLRAVVNAILMDPEARTVGGADYGRLRAPVEMMSVVLRSLDVRLDGGGGLKDPAGVLNRTSAKMGQDLARPPSVFSYYQPDTPAPESDTLVGPEFGIMDTATVSERANFLQALLFGTDVIGGAPLADAGVTVDVGRVPTAPTELIAWIDDTWFHGAMTAALATALRAALTTSPVSDAVNQRRLALYLAAMAPEFQIQR